MIKGDAASTWTPRDRLSCTQRQISVIAADAQELLTSLESGLQQGLPHEKLCALRLCIERALIANAPQAAMIPMGLVRYGIPQSKCELRDHLNSRKSTE